MLFWNSHDFHHLSYSNLFLWKAGTGFGLLEVWQKRLVIVIDIYPVRQTWKIERWMIHRISIHL
jgi:hypothetical protein